MLNQTRLDHAQSRLYPWLVIGQLFLLLLSLGACRRSVQAPNPIEIDRAEYARMFEAAQRVLRDEGFMVDRSDYRFGSITTQPRSSPTMFEVWRPTNRNWDQVVQSTVNDERRVVQVSFEPMPRQELLMVPSPQTVGEPAPEPARSDAYGMRVEVTIERLQWPTRQLTGSTSGQRIMNTLTTTPEELAVRNIEDAYWLPLSRDPLLEQHLVAAIVRRSIEMANPVPPSSTQPSAPLPLENTPATTPAPTPGM